ncbi:MAG: SRPBCC domain-containing protein [Alphaproteobacteria bacterium]|nr:MAG: SRPBCC domain-containing protein [Alphaproteobacteria bacterium]
MSKPQSPSLTLKRKLSAPAEKVFAAWTDPEKIIHWFGPAETADGSVRADMDVRVGGRFRISFRDQDGEYHEVGGTYREVVPNERLVFSWAWHSTPERESLVTITLKPDGDATMLTLHHERFFDEKARDGHERGWSGTLEKLARYLS